MAKNRWLLIETSGREGLVGLGDGDAMASEVRLDAARSHARDLVPAVKGLLDEMGWRSGDLSGIAVSQGPGSYTGLRVGIMAARALTYALGCRLVAVPTFSVIARQASESATTLHVIADALKGKLYVQSFARADAGAAWSPSTELQIVARAAWLAELRDTIVTGPGVVLIENQLPSGVAAVPVARRAPGLPALLQLARSAKSHSDAMGPLEPLYLRASSGEEQWSGSTSAGLIEPGACTSPS